MKKTELLAEIGMIEGLCKIENTEQELDNLSAVASAIQLQQGIELTDAGSFSEIESMIAFSIKNN